jgi:hypothetical protein
MSISITVARCHVVQQQIYIQFSLCFHGAVNVKLYMLQNKKINIPSTFLLRLFQRSCIYGIEKKSCGIVASHDTDLEFNFCFPVYQIILGTIETKDSADIEWVYRPYMNTAKKRKFLAEDE